jgi:thermostable 8-oxoguanine DNA glycosylase
MEITKEFVARWAREYDLQQTPKKRAAELAIVADCRSLREPKSLNRDLFLRICVWKLHRQRPRYESNSEEQVLAITRQACSTSDDVMKLTILRSLHGVGPKVGSALLHFLEPNRFPIFDERACTTLKAAGLWRRSVEDDSPEAWLDYLGVMRDLSGRLGVTLRELDKALFAYDAYR